MNARTKAIFCRIIPAVAFCLYSIISSAQVFPSPSASWGIYPRRGVFDSVIYLPAGCGAPSGTASLNSAGFGNGQKLKLIAIYGDTCGHQIYWYDPSDSTWSPFAGGSSDSGLAVQYQALTGVPIAKFVDGSGHRFVLYDTTGNHPGAMGTNAGIQKKIDSISAVINALLAAKFGLTDTGYTKTLASVFTLAKVRDSLAAVFNAGLGTKFSAADTGYAHTLASIFTLAKVRDSLAALIAGSGGGITTLTGDVTAGPGSGSLAATIGANKVTNAKAAQMATNTLKGNNTVSTANPADLTVSQVMTMLNAVSNFLGVQQVGYGLYANHPTGSQTALYFASDSVLTGGLFYWDGSAMHNLTPQVSLSVRGLGQPGDTTMTTLSGNTVSGFHLNVAAMRDSSGSCVHHAFNPDGSLTFYSTCTVVSIDTSSHHLTASVTQNQSTYRFTITRFGAIRDSTVDNTAAIQMAIDSCNYYGGGTVYVPAGVWLIKQLRLDNRQNVIVMGEGRASVFKADSACAMIVGYNTNFPGVNASIRGTGGVRNIALRGHGLATYGMQLYYNYWFSMPGISIDSCTIIGIQLKGTLTGEFSDLTIEHCPIGVMADTVNLSPGGQVASNLIKFNNIRLYYCSTWGLWCNKTEINIEVDNGDFEYDGTIHNQATGAINITNSDGSGLARFQNCDFEQNLGDVISITGNTGAASYEFNHCNVLINGSASIGLNSNPSISLQNILLDGTYIKNDSLDVYTTGYTRITELNGGTYGTDNNSAGTRWFFAKNISYNGTTDHLISSATGTTVLLKNGAGSGATISLSSGSTDVSGIITITTGSSPLPSDTLCYIVQSSSQWVTTGIVTILSPANTAAKSLAGDAQVWAPGNSSSPYYSYILTGTDALLPSTTYKWAYINSGR